MKRIVEEEGASFAFPSSSIYVETLPDDRPERYAPPDSENEGDDESDGTRPKSRQPRRAPDSDVDGE